MPDHNHKRCIETALRNAAEICRERNVHFTAIRRRVLELVWKSHQAIKAYEVLDLLAKDGRKPQPPTVYRALDFLVEHGLVHKVESQNSFIGCVHPDHGHNCQLLICEKCGIVEELCNEDVTNQLTRSAKAKGFHIKNITLEIKGICPKCN